jgi:hypothetical protein
MSGIAHRIEENIRQLSGRMGGAGQAQQPAGVAAAAAAALGDASSGEGPVALWPGGPALPGAGSLSDLQAASSTLSNAGIDIELLQRLADSETDTSSGGTTAPGAPAVEVTGTTSARRGAVAGGLAASALLDDANCGRGDAAQEAAAAPTGQLARDGSITSLPAAKRARTDAHAAHPPPAAEQAAAAGGDGGVSRAPAAAAAAAPVAVDEAWQAAAGQQLLNGGVGRPGSGIMRSLGRQGSILRQTQVR